MHIRIDVDACQGHNRCALAYPEIFDVDDDVKAFVHVDKIPPEWEEKSPAGDRELPRARN